MYQELNVKLIEAKGSYYQIGIKQGEALELDYRFQRLTMLNEAVDSNIANAALEVNSPGILEEIRGLADGSGVDFDTALKVFSGYDMAFPSMGCTSFSQGSYYVRNYDFSPKLYDGRLILTKPENGYASVGFSQQIIGRLDGMNEHGLVAGLHLVNEGHKGSGFVATTIVRLLLEQCKNVDEAIDMIKKVPHGYCFNYSLMDRDGNTCVVEATPEKQVVYRKLTLMCTNHFESDSLRLKNRSYIELSLQRKKILQEYEPDEFITPAEAYHKFNNEASPLFYKEYESFFGTLHTVVYLPETLELMVGIGGNFSPVTFSLSEWVRGELEVKGDLVGQIDVKR